MPAPPQNKTTFMAGLLRSASEYFHLRNGNHKTPAPFAYKLQLFHDLLFQIPGKDDHKIRLSFANLVGMIDGNMRARQKTALFVRAAIDCIRNQILADAAIVKKRRALAGRAISRY